MRRAPRLFLALALALCWLGQISVSHALSEGNTHLIEYLTQEKTNLIAAINQIKLTQTPKDEAEYKELVKKNQALTTLNQANISSLASLLVNQQAIQADFSERIKQLQRTDRGEVLAPNSQQIINKINTLNTIHKNIITLIQGNLRSINRLKLCQSMKSVCPKPGKSTKYRVN